MEDLLQNSQGSRTHHWMHFNVIHRIPIFGFMVLRQCGFRHEQCTTESLPPPRAVLSQIFPAGRGNAPEIILADILETQLGASNLSFTRGKLCIEDVLRDSSFIHPVDMAQLSETTLSQ